MMRLRDGAQGTYGRGRRQPPVGLSGKVTMTERTWRPAARAVDTVRASCSASGTPAEPATITSLVARGIGIAILPRLAVAEAERRVAIRDLPHGLDLARDIHAVARTASVRRPSVAVIVTAVRAAAKAMPPQGPHGR